MTRVAALVAVAAALAVPVALASGPSARPPLLGIVGNQGSSHLVRLDPLTLRALGSRSLALPDFGDWARSPNGSRLVFAGHRGLLQFVDVRTLRRSGRVPLRGFTSPAVSWLSSRTLLVLDAVSVAAVDPVGLRVRWRKALPEALAPLLFEREARSATGLVFLLSQADGSVGPTTLVSIDTSGRVRSVALSRITSGAQQVPGASLFTGSAPGLAVDPGTDTAYVVGGDGAVATVDLRTLTASYPYRTRTLQKVLSGPTRRALWLGDGLLAVTGEDDRAGLDTSNHYQETVAPIGLTILDTHTWQARLVDPTASTAAFAGGLLLAWGESWDSTAGTSNESPNGSGVGAYTAAGSRVFHALGDAPVAQVQAANGLAYAWQYTPGPNVQAIVSVLDLGSGRALRTITSKASRAPWLLVPS